ncbi:glycosyltransferase family 2 protein [Candidatus Chloroploca sp. Khr17]|uniref:glycosyltransferase family 2 protein n=1 Tax=Candidatus Chloroploca sp. Khr17 TaxID=2496869 RepID=UPI00101BCF5C|nr:glycosyltransferase family 2 protein [Candidatus Chloroploca sp. Khr17]
MLQVSPASHQPARDDDTLPGSTIALIPAYNEARFIGSIVLAVRPLVDIVIVVDDGSTDKTAEIARRAGAIVVKHEMNQGKTTAVNTGFTYALQHDPAALVMLDGDGQHCATDIPVVLAPVLNDQADVVVGSRFLEVKNDIPVYRQFGQHGLNVVTNLTSGVSLSDTQSGFRAFSRTAIERLSFRQRGFAIESEMQFLLRDHQLRVVEVPINVTYADPPKRNPVSHGMQVINCILRLVGQSRPLLFFSTAGLAVLLIGFVLGSYIIHIYVDTHELAIGYGLMTVICCVIGVLLIFAGIILHSTRGMLLDMQQSLLNRMLREGKKR